MQNWVRNGCSPCFPSINPPTPSLSESPLETGLTWARQAGRRYWPGKHSMVRCCVVCWQLQKTHTDPSRWPQKRERQANRRELPGISYMGVQWGKERERDANLTSFSFRQQRGLRRKSLLWRDSSKDQSQNHVKMWIHVSSSSLLSSSHSLRFRKLCPLC